MKLPDFGKYFHTTNRSPIDFETRFLPNGLHDLIFLSSYLHDATVETKKILLQTGILYIPMERVRWELYRGKNGTNGIASVLKIANVLRIKWDSLRGSAKNRKTPGSSEFSIRHIYLSHRYGFDSEKEEIVFVGHGENPSVLKVTVRVFFTLRMTDVGKKRKVVGGASRKRNKKKST